MNTINLCGKIHEIRPQEKVTYITLHCKDNKQSEFIDITIFNNEFFNKYFKKGQWMTVNGHLHNNKYRDVFRLEVIADTVGFAGNKEEYREIPLTQEELDLLPFPS